MQTRCEELSLRVKSEMRTPRERSPDARTVAETIDQRANPDFLRSPMDFVFSEKLAKGDLAIIRNGTRIVIDGQPGSG